MSFWRKVSSVAYPTQTQEFVTIDFHEHAEYHKTSSELLLQNGGYS
jgi:hypothetical protein